MPERLVLGTRGSALALAQSAQVARALEAASGGAVAVHLEVITTRGDLVQDRPLREVGGKGLFTAELEAALRSGAVDLAVHSLKDLPTEQPEGLDLGGVPRREDPRDVLVGAALAALPPGARVGTGSPRRAAQLLARRPDLQVLGVRGNVDTRIHKYREGQFEAVVLAEAGLARLGLDLARHPLDPAVCLPAPGQGALGIQLRADDARTRALVQRLHHADTADCVAAERAFLAALQGGCSVPAAALALPSGEGLWLRAALADAEGRVHRAERRVPRAEGPAAGRALAEALRGAAA